MTKKLDCDLTRLNASTVKVVSLYCVAFFDTSERKEPTLRAFFDMKEALIYFQHVNHLFPYIFTKDIFISDGHPLYNIAGDICVTHSPIRLI